MVSTAVTLCGVALDNPVIPASGTFGFGQEFTPYYDINVLGSLSFKGTTQEARFGNPTPRIAECPNGMLNSVGLQNPGIDHVIAHELPELRKIFHKPIMANISGFSLEEYVDCCARMDAEEQVAFLEVNISCPNVRHGGMAFGLDRLVMLMLGCDSIRDVIAYPKVANSGELMTASPAPVDQKQLDELGISINLQEETKE